MTGPTNEGRGAALRAEVMEFGRKGFERGYSAAAEQLTEPITATWLADTTGLPEGRCRDLLAELRGILLIAAVKR